MAREAATQTDAGAAKAINEDWRANFDARQINRWTEALGRIPLEQQKRQILDMESGIHPAAPANAPELLVVEVDGGRWQGREKDPVTQGCWREDKVCTVIKYLPGDGGQREPVPLVSSVVATTGDVREFGPLCRLEAERRGLRDAQQVLVIADGGNWIDPLVKRTLHGIVRILDYYHASEHVWEVARAVCGGDERKRERYGEQLEAWLWDGQTRKLLGELSRQSKLLGPPAASVSAEDPRRVVASNLQYFTHREDQMDYPAYRAKGWPIGSGQVEAGVKQFNKRIKGTEQFWRPQRLETILVLRGLWISQDERWDHYWSSRPAYPSRIAA